MLSSTSTWRGHSAMLALGYVSLSCQSNIGKCLKWPQSCSVKGKVEGKCGGFVSMLQRSHTTLHSLPPGHWVKFMQAPSELHRKHTSMGPWEFIAFHSQIFIHYSYRCPFILLGRQRRSRLSILPMNANTNTASREGFEPKSQLNCILGPSMKRRSH